MKLSTSIIMKLIIILLVPFSCKEADNSSIPIIDIVGNIDNFKPYNLSDLACDLNYVFLESTEDAMIMDIRFLDISDDHILVADRDNCLLFDRSGKFLSKIGRQGRGPGDNNVFTQVKILQDKIFLPDGLTNEINIFSTKGEFLKTVKSPGAFTIAGSHNWMVVTDSSYLIQMPDNNTYENYRIALINDNGKILNGFTISSLFDDHEGAYALHSWANFYTHNDSFFYKELLNDTIWLITKDHIEPVHVTNLAQYEFSFDYNALSGMSFLKRIIETIRASVIFESDEHICFIMYLGRAYPLEISKIIEGPGPGKYRFISFYNKQNDEFFLVAPSNVDHQIEPTGIKNDIDGGINFMPRYAVNDRHIVSWFEAYELKIYVASESFKNSTPKYPEKKKELEELAATLDEDDNPVLMLVTLKD